MRTTNIACDVPATPGGCYVAISGGPDTKAYKGWHPPFEMCGSKGSIRITVVCIRNAYGEGYHCVLTHLPGGWNPPLFPLPTSYMMGAAPQHYVWFFKSFFPWLHGCVFVACRHHNLAVWGVLFLPSATCVGFSMPHAEPEGPSCTTPCSYGV
jgi:hypothetical protein